MACIENNALAARAHAHALKISKLHLNSLSQVPLHLGLMYNDAEYALAQMRRTHLRPEDGVNQSVRHLWSEVEEMLLPIPGWDRVPECIENNVLQMAMSRIRRILMVTDGGWAAYAHHGIDFADKAHGWMATRAAHDKGSLMNRCLDLLEYKALTDEVTSDGRRYTEVDIALRSCYTIKKSIFVYDVNGIDLTNTSQVVLPRVEEILKRAMLTATTRERVKYEQAWLWICFLGAHHESRVRLGIVKNSLMASGWFQEKMMELKGGMAWRDVKAVLDKFVYISYLEPEPGSWFLSTIEKEESILERIESN